MHRFVVELHAALRTPARLGAIWLMMACLGVVLAQFLPCCGPQFFFPITTLLTLAALFAAFRLGLAVLAMLGDLRELRTPGRLPALAGSAIGVVLLVSAVIPAIALAIALRSADPALALANAVLTGLLLARLPRWLVYSLISAAAVLFVAHRFSIWGGVLGVLLTGLQRAPWWLTWGVEVLLVAWLWRPVLVGDSRTLEAAARRAAVWGGWARVTRR
jgi:hypothetical protein